MKTLLKVLVVVASVQLGALVVTAMLQAAYPGSYELTAPVLCPDDQPDAFVVRYHVQSGNGTGINFTLFCMNDRGEFTEVGTWRPMGVVFAFVSVALHACAVLVVLWWRLRRRGSRDHEPSAPPIHVSPPSYIGRVSS